MRAKQEKTDSTLATPDVEEVKARGRLVKSDYRYQVYDYVHDGITYSVTELRPNSETRGHHHDAVEEQYFFKAGKGRFIMGGKIYDVDADSMDRSRLTFRVPMGEFHKVQNTSSRPLIFLAAFAGTRGATKAVYSDGGSGAEATARMLEAMPGRHRSRSG